MLRVQISNDMRRENRVLQGSQTLRQALEAEGIDTMSGTFLLDGQVIPVSYLDKTFEELGVGENVRLTRAGHKNNAR